ncbi:restriction endonuclease subunit S, partial [Psittacicella hinzii]
LHDALSREAKLRNTQYWNALYELMSPLENLDKDVLGNVSISCSKGKKDLPANKRISGNIPYQGANGIVDYIDSYTHEGEYLLIARIGAPSLSPYSIRKYAGRFWATSNVHILKVKETYNLQFLFHYLRSLDFTPYINNPNSRTCLNEGSLLSIPVPKISLEEQKRIAHILDTILELKETVEQEVELRRKQFEYYKYWLLNPEGKLETMP